MILAGRNFGEEFYENGTKIVPRNISKKDIDNDIVLASWYMDDGCLNNNAIILCTDCFCKEDNQKLVDILSEIGITATLQRHIRGKKEFYRLYIGNGQKYNKSNIKFWERVAPYITTSFRYKLPKFISDKIPYNEKLWDINKESRFIDKAIIYQGQEPKYSKKSKSKFVYCIDVEDNHNFISGDIILHNCAATNLPVLHNDLDIKWYDIGPGFDSFSYEEIVPKLTENTRVLTIVSWGGSPINYGTLCNICNYYFNKFGHELQIIEDRAHCPVGHYSEHSSFFSAYSFQAIKHLTTGDGGLLVCPDKYIKNARLMRWFGLDRDQKMDFRAMADIKLAGMKIHMNNINAAIGLANLNSFEYHQAVKDQVENIEKIVNGVTNPHIDFAAGTWMLTCLVEDQAHLAEYLKYKQIETSQVHKRNDKLTVFSKYKTDLPRLDYYENRYLVIPSGWWLDRDPNHQQVDYIIKVLNGYRPRS